MNTRLSVKQMNTTSPRLRVPERWLLIGLDKDWCDTAKERLARIAESFPSASFLSWRLAHGLIRVVAPADLDNELKTALSRSEGVKAMPNATRLWAAMTADEWFEISKSCVALRWPWTRGLDVSLLSADASSEATEDFAEFIEAADQPDVLSRFSWLMSERRLPVPGELLSLGPLPELSDSQNAKLAEEGYRCYSAWAENVMASYEPEKLQARWGPFPEDEETDEETEKPVDPPLTSGKSLLPQRLPGRSSGRFAANDQTMELAAAVAGTASGDSPAHDWALDPTFSHGAYCLQAWVRSPKSREEKSGIEFVALWNDGKKTHLQPDDVRLVLTLSRAKPEVLAGRPDKDPATGSLFSMRFEWPYDSWPKGLSDVPSLHLKRRLKEALEKARVSLM